MHLNHMFPSKTLNGEDFVAALGPGVHTLTIETVTEKLFENTRSGEGPEVVFYLKFSQFKKPIKLNQSNAWAIADATGCHDSDEWIGKSIKVCAYSKSIVENTGGRPSKKVIWVFDIIAERPTDAPLSLLAQDITGQAEQVKKGLAQPAALLKALPAGGGRASASEPGTIGMEVALKIHNELFVRNRTDEDAAKYLSASAPQIGHAIAGKNLPEWPNAALPWLRRLIGDLPKVNNRMKEAALEQQRQAWTEPKQEVIDPKTGEVLPTGPTDDIPF